MASAHAHPIMLWSVTLKVTATTEKYVARKSARASSWSGGLSVPSVVQLFGLYGQQSMKGATILEGLFSFSAMLFTHTDCLRW